MKLHNKFNSKELKESIHKSEVNRTTISFYKYHLIENPQEFRDSLYIQWERIGVLGRIYVANEGINAQLSVPTENFETFRTELYQIDFLNGIRLNIAVDDDGKSFFKLAIKVREKIVADGIKDPAFDVTKIGQHLKAADFNALISNEETIVVDMRNHYESEIGHFDRAILPDVLSFREQLPKVASMLENNKEQPILMYCTGGIRCEKASAYMLYKGFKNVYQLEGGIIKYANDIKEQGLENKFKGKNFVFDERLGEKIGNEVISKCHQCGEACDTHTNCANVACNLLFIQCESCKEKYSNCCDSDCQAITALPEDEQKELRKGSNKGRLVFNKGKKLKTGI